MSFLERAKQAAEQARQAAVETSELEGKLVADVVDDGEHLVTHAPGDETITALDGTTFTDADLAATHDLSGDDAAIGHAHPES